MTGPAHPPAAASGLTSGLPPAPKPAASLDFSSQREAFIKAAQKLEVQIDNSPLSEDRLTAPIVDITINTIGTLQEMLTELSRTGRIDETRITQHQVKLTADAVRFMLHGEGKDGKSNHEDLSYAKPLLTLALDVLSYANSGEYQKAHSAFEPVISKLENRAARIVFGPDKQRVYEQSVGRLLA